MKKKNNSRKSYDGFSGTKATAGLKERDEDACGTKSRR
jgi:hypothetical protein